MRSHSYRLELLSRLMPMSKTFKRQLKRYFDSIEFLCIQIKSMEKEMYGHLKQHYFLEYLRLLTIPGVGGITAASIIAMVGDWSRFKSGRKLISYLGIIPSIRISDGKKVGSNAITKQGNSLARGYLVQAALGVLKSRNEDAKQLQEWYQAMRIKKGWKKARVCLARKLCVIMYGMIKDGTDYNPTLLTKNSKPVGN